MSNWPIAAAAAPIPIRPYLDGDNEQVMLPISTTAHQKTAWVEVCAATPQHATALVLSASVYGDNDSRHLIDVGVGPVGSEQVLVGNIGLQAAGYRGPAQAVTLPVAIPQGTRVSVRQQTSVTSGVDPLRVQASIIPPSALHLPGYQCIGTFGADPAVTSLTPVLERYGYQSWVQILAATPARARAAILMHNGRHPTAGGAAFGSRALTYLGAGPAGAERHILSNLTVGTLAGIPWGAQLSGPFPVDIPAGTRLACAVTNSNATNYHAMGVILFG